MAGEYIPVTGAQEGAIEATGGTEEVQSMWGKRRSVAVERTGGYVGMDRFSQGVLKEGGSAGDVSRGGKGSRVAFDLGVDVLPVGIPVGTVVILDEFGWNGVGISAWAGVVGRNGEQDRIMVASNRVEDFRCNTPKEVWGHKDDIRSGVALRTGVAGKGDEVPGEGSKELTPPGKFGLGATVDIEVGGNNIGGEGLVYVGEEIVRKRVLGTDVDSGTGDS